MRTTLLAVLGSILVAFGVVLVIGAAVEVSPTLGMLVAGLLFTVGGVYVLGETR